jgi:hypothetical protein
MRKGKLSFEEQAAWHTLMIRERKDEFASRHWRHNHLTAPDSAVSNNMEE